MTKRKTMVYKTLIRKLMIEQRTPPETACELRCSRRVSSFCSTSGTRHVTHNVYHDKFRTCHSTAFYVLFANEIIWITIHVTLKTRSTDSWFEFCDVICWQSSDVDHYPVLSSFTTCHQIWYVDNPPMLITIPSFPRSRLVTRFVRGATEQVPQVVFELLNL